jgi:hypothetical protein
MTHFVIWRGLDGWRAETATIELHDDGLTATGTQIGAGYRLDYKLDDTRSIEIVATGDGWTNELDLRHDGHGNWSQADLTGVLDCDLGFSPLTNTLPIRRSGLHRRPGAEDFLMAWIEVPELRVLPSAQRYEHVRPGVVRYVDRGAFAGFTAELEVDADGLVTHYPGLAEQVTTPST